MTFLNEIEMDISKNLSDLNKDQMNELEGYIEELITLKAYIESFIEQNKLDEDEVMEKIYYDYNEAMSRQHG